MTSAYPENWNEIATQIKQISGYCCQRCGMQCLHSGRGYHHRSRRIAIDDLAGDKSISMNPIWFRLTT